VAEAAVVMVEDTAAGVGMAAVVPEVAVTSASAAAMEGAVAAVVPEVVMGTAAITNSSFGCT